MGTNHSDYRNIFGKALGSFIICSVLIGVTFAGGIAGLGSNDPGSSSITSASFSRGSYSHHMVFIIMENNPLDGPVGLANAKETVAL